MKHILKTIVIAILTLEARMVLRKYKPHIVAVTGNVGKTSTKNAVYALLNKVYYVRKSQKSFNSEIGVPLTILGCDTGWSSPILWFKNILEGLALIFLKNHYPKWLILEVGAGAPGEIRKTAKWLRPDIVIVTRIGSVPVHVEFFDGPEDVAREKESLVVAQKQNGLLVLNRDDARVYAMREKTHVEVITYGNSPEATISSSHKDIMYDKTTNMPIGVRFRVNYGSSSLPVQLFGTAGFQHIEGILAAFAVAVSRGINLISATEWIAEYKTSPGRSKIIEGIHHTTIVDDTYNASPISVFAALDTLNQIKSSGRKIAVLGDMMELGKYSKKEHDDVGNHVAQVSDILITVGVRAQDIAHAAQKSGMKGNTVVTMVNDSRAAGRKLRDILKEGDTILVKGSQAVRMERVVETVMRYPEKKDTLLARQDSAWITK